MRAKSTRFDVVSDGVGFGALAVSVGSKMRVSGEIGESVTSILWVVSVFINMCRGVSGFYLRGLKCKWVRGRKSPCGSCERLLCKCSGDVYEFR